ncbi:transmembrane protein 59-like [Dreissena polymorpha]|uniref:Transmembrane protein 59 n=1 Tax=Dreissena polymorpha TaxID=45954 RepID=A0A9D3YD15_DREPO|nr:transmembrane protein 59-like [Dreissena polymorpha]KAH3698293.1 hypothetical protein DPMN_085812 [Dreissena polymorpha]
MATKLFCFGAIVFVLVPSTVCDVFDSILDDVSSCKQACKNTFTPHTFEKSGSEECCNRGCRLFSMVEFIYDDLNTTTEVCISSCQEAYTVKDDFEACKLGCQSQKPFAIEHLLADDPWEQHIHLVDPFSYLHGVYSSMFNTIVSQATVSWTMYMSNSDGTVMVVKSPSQYKVMSMGPGGVDTLNDDEITASFIETNIKPLDNSATPYLKTHSYGAQRNDDDLIHLSARDIDASIGPHDDHMDWLSCVATKTGLPRLLLSWLLLMCAIVMIWLCLSAAVTAPEQKVYTEPKKLSINGDQEVIAEMLAKGVKPCYPQVRPELSFLPIKISVHRI